MEAEAIQRKIDRFKIKHPVQVLECYAARNAADRIALKIRYGRISEAGNHKGGRNGRDPKVH